jgi:hypothetical protein
MSKAVKAKARPGLKLATPLEEQKTDAAREAIRLRWEHLFSLNVWKPSK